MKILMVDDAVFIRKVLKGILQELGIELVREASNGSEALKILKEFSPDVVTLDITLPDMSGIELLRKIKSINPSADVIMISAINTHDIVKEALREGAAGYITKPFSREKVEEVLKSLERKKKGTIPEEKEEVDLQQQLSQQFDGFGLEQKIETVPVNEQESSSVILNIPRDVFGTQEEIKHEEIEETEHKDVSTSPVEIESSPKYSILTDIKFEQINDEERVNLYFNKKEVNYSIGRMKIRNGIMVTIEDCHKMASIRETYELNSGVIERVKINEVEGNLYISIETNVRKFDIRELDDGLIIIFRKSKGLVVYNKTQRFLMIDNVSPNSVKINKINEKNYVVEIVSSGATFQEGEEIVEDPIIDRYVVSRKGNDYIVNILLKTEASYELIEGRTSLGIRFNEIKILKDIDVFYTPEETLLELITNSSNVSADIEQEQDKNIVYVFLNGFMVSEELLSKEFTFNEEPIESLKVVYDSEKNQACIIIYTPIKKVNFIKQKGKNLISLKPNRAFILFNIFQESVVFQNIKPDELMVEFLAETNELYFKVKNRFVNLIKDPMIDTIEGETVSYIEVNKISEGYEGKIGLKGKCKYRVELSRDKTSTDIYIVPVRKLNKVNSFEYEEKEGKAYLKIKGEGELNFEWNYEKSESILNITFKEASLGKIESRHIDFTDHCIEWILFDEDNYNAYVKVKTSVEDFEIERIDAGLEIEFRLLPVEIVIEEDEDKVSVKVPALKWQEVELNNDIEEQTVNLQIKRKDIYLRPGITYLEKNYVIRKYQIIKEDGYRVAFTANTIVRLNRKDSSSVEFTIEKCPVLQEIKIFQGALRFELILNFNVNNVGLKESFTKDSHLVLNLGEVVLGDGVKLPDNFERGIVRKIEIEMIGEDVVLEIEKVYSKINIIQEGSNLIVRFDVEKCEIIINEEEIVLRNLNVEKVEENIIAENNLIIFYIPKTEAMITSDSIVLNGNILNYFALDNDLSGEVWKLYLALKRGISLNDILKEKDEIYIFVKGESI